MQEILEASMRAYTMPFTGLLILAVLFWLLMILGGGDVSALDLDFDADVDIDFNADGEGLVNAATPPGILYPIAQALHLGKIPIMIPMTIIVLFTWLASIYGEAYFNPEHNKVIGFALLIPYMFGGLVSSWLLGLPLRKVFHIMNYNPEDMQMAIGSICEVACPSDEKYGRALIHTDNAPMQILIYTHAGERYEKGDKAKVISFNQKLSRYLVEKES